MKINDYLYNSFPLHQSKAFHHAASTPLSSLLINLELAQEHQKLSKSPYVKQALNSAYRLKDLFELPLKPKSKQFQVKIFLQESLNLVNQLYPQVVINQHLNFPQGTRLYGNRFYFQEAVICSVKNAIESYSSISKTNRTVLVSGKITKSDLILTFIDGGRGMNWLEKNLMFADGFTNKKEGTGIGLTWVKKVIENHFSGQIKVLSQKHHGTTMIWTLPLYDKR
ncbi:HAMP domain-containing histidine kinase [Patescibacteria group bacterium]|nr:HAMP domain-containing histidine kinase [Patescibacteria group bacterium]